MLAHEDGFLEVEGDGGDLGAVNLGELVGLHVGHGALLAADADEAATLGNDTGFLELVVGAHDEPGAVGVGNLFGDDLGLLLIGGRQIANILVEVGDILVEVLDNHLVVLEFGEQLGNLGFLGGAALLKAGDIGLEVVVLAIEGFDATIELTDFLLVGGHGLLKGSHAVSDGATVGLGILAAHLLHDSVFGLKLCESAVDLVEHSHEAVALGKANVLLGDDIAHGVNLLLSLGFGITIAGHKSESSN